MHELKLFTDGSVNTSLKIGYGAYLVVSEKDPPLDSLESDIKLKRFEHTSSTKLELQTLLWALNDIAVQACKVIVYTDSQNVMGLQQRRRRLERNNYRTKKNKLLNNYKLYQEFYGIIDRLDCEFVKVRGHKVSNKKNHTDRIFTLVDRASRKALRKEFVAGA